MIPLNDDRDIVMYLAFGRRPSAGPDTFLGRVGVRRLPADVEQAQNADALAGCDNITGRLRSKTIAALQRHQISGARLSWPRCVRRAGERTVASPARPTGY